MRAPISVIIPTLNAANDLPRCLGALMPGLDAGLIREVIISDGGSGDATVPIAMAWGCEVVHGEASRGGQLMRGCAAAKAPWLLVLHADSVLGSGWITACVAHDDPARAGWFDLAFDPVRWQGRTIAGLANLRSRFGLPYGDQGLFISRVLYDEIGGYCDIALMEDVAIARALRGRLVRLGAVITTSGSKYIAQGWCRRSVRNLGILTRYFLGADPNELAQRYRG